LVLLGKLIFFPPPPPLPPHLKGERGEGRGGGEGGEGGGEKINLPNKTNNTSLWACCTIPI